MLLQVCEHLIEVGPAAHPRGFDVFEYPHNRKTFARRILTKKAFLGREAEPLHFLVLAGYSHVQHNANGLKRCRAPRRSRHI